MEIAEKNNYDKAIRILAIIGILTNTIPFISACGRANITWISILRNIAVFIFEVLILIHFFLYKYKTGVIISIIRIPIMFAISSTKFYIDNLAYEQSRLASALTLSMLLYMALLVIMLLLYKYLKEPGEHPTMRTVLVILISIALLDSFIGIIKSLTRNGVFGAVSVFFYNLCLFLILIKPFEDNKIEEANTLTDSEDEYSEYYDEYENFEIYPDPEDLNDKE